MCGKIKIWMILLIICVIAYDATYAQKNNKFYLGFSTSATILNGKTTRYSGNYQNAVNIKNAPGLRYGLSYAFFFNDDFCFQSGLYWGLQSEYITVTINNDDLSFFDFSLRSLHNIEVPFLLKLYLNINGFNPSISLGSDIRFYSQLISYSTVTYPDLYVYIQNNYGYLKSYYISFHAETSITINCQGSNSLELSLLASLNGSRFPIMTGYFEIYDTQNKLLEYGEHIYKNSYFGFAVSYLINR